MFSNLKIRSIFILNLALSLTLIIIFCTFIYNTVAHVLKTNLIYQGRDKTASLTQIQVANHIPPEIFSEPDLATTQQAFDSFFKEIHTNEILRIKVWDKNARIIATDDPALVGLSFSDNKLFQQAIKGETVVEIKAPAEPENIKEQGYNQLMEVYVSITDSNKKIVGVVETHTILDSLNSQITTTQNTLLLQIIMTSIPLLIFLGATLLLFYKNISNKISALIKHVRVLGSGNLDEKIAIIPNVHRFATF